MSDTILLQDLLSSKKLSQLAIVANSEVHQYTLSCICFPFLVHKLYFFLFKINFFFSSQVVRSENDHMGLFLLYCLLASSQDDSKAAIDFEETGSGFIQTGNNPAVHHQVLTLNVNTKNLYCYICFLDWLGKHLFTMNNLCDEYPDSTQRNDNNIDAVSQAFLYLVS